jgi:hypothetical protein
VTNPLLVLFRWLWRRGGGFDLLSACIGTAVLTIVLTQWLWTGWVVNSPSPSLPAFIENRWLSILSLVVLLGVETFVISRHLRTRTSFSAWYAALPMLPIVCFVACHPDRLSLRVCLIVAFIVLQTPLFVDWRVKD